MRATMEGGPSFETTMRSLRLGACQDVHQDAEFIPGSILLHSSVTTTVFFCHNECLDICLPNAHPDVEYTSCRD